MGFFARWRAERLARQAMLLKALAECGYDEESYVRRAMRRKLAGLKAHLGSYCSVLVLLGPVLWSRDAYYTCWADIEAAIDQAVRERS